MSNHSERKPFDLTEEASKRNGDEKATSIARQVESDDVNEEMDTGPVNTDNDNDVENEVWTSASDE